MTRKNPQMKSTQFKGNSRHLNNHPKSTNTHTKTLGELKTFPLNSYVHSRHLEIWVNSSSNAFFDEKILMFLLWTFWRNVNIFQKVAQYSCKEWMIHREMLFTEDVHLYILSNGESAINIDNIRILSVRIFAPL